MTGRYKGSKLDNWGTPQYVFDYFNERYAYDLDLAAQPHNAKCKDFCSLETGRDAFEESLEGRRVWCNPPYGNIAEWINLMFRRPTFITFLVPVRSGQRWFDDCLSMGNIDFIRGRLSFTPPPDYVGELNSAPFDVAACHFEGYDDELRRPRQITIPRPPKTRIKSAA